MSINEALQIPDDHLWGDQRSIFMKIDLQNPYTHPGFVNPPFVAVLLLPLSLLPFKLAMLIQFMATFIFLALIIDKLGGGTIQTILCLTSFFAFDFAFEPNVDWLVYLGLLLPSNVGIVFLMIKPQIATGIIFTYTLSQLIRAGLIIFIVLCLTTLLWRSWIQDLRRNLETSILYRPANVAPMHFLPAPLSILIGASLGCFARWRRDISLGLLAWLFFVPYIAIYSLLFYFAITLIRFPLLGKIIYVCTWVIYGGALLIGSWMI